ncbi:MAG: putative inner rane transporter YhbE [Pseudomonadota bacterium]
MNPTVHSPRRGFALALLTALTWGSLPVAMALLVRQLTPWTVTWWRLAGSAVLLGSWLAWRGQLPALRALARRQAFWLALATFGLVGNYVCYANSLRFTTPSVSQTVIQLAPMLLLLSGLVLFGERFSRGQWAGFALLTAGLLLFFNRRLPEIAGMHGSLAMGVGLVVLSSMLWTGYGIAQKKLMSTLAPTQILVVLYAAGALVLSPLAQPGAALHLDPQGIGLLLFGVANTLVGYGSFAEALAVWDVTRVSAVTSVAPVVTLTSMALLNKWAPGTLPHEGLNALSLAGAVAVVAGSVACALTAHTNQARR